MGAKKKSRSGFDWSTVPDADEQGESAKRRLLDNDPEPVASAKRTPETKSSSSGPVCVQSYVRNGKVVKSYSRKKPVLKKFCWIERGLKEYGEFSGADFRSSTR